MSWLDSPASCAACGYLWEVLEQTQDPVTIVQQSIVARGQLQEELGPRRIHWVGLRGQDPGLELTCKFQVKRLKSKKKED